MTRHAVMLPAIFLAGWGASLDAAENEDGGAKKPLVLFIGDSVTVGQTREDYKKSALFSPRIGTGRGNKVSYGYVEALCEATFDRDIPYRFDKICSGGQSISGKFPGLKYSFRKVLEKRYQDLDELPAILIYQDFHMLKGAEDVDAHKAAIREIAGWAGEAGVRFVLSTVAWESGGTFVSKYPDADLKATNQALLEVAAEQQLPVIRLDMAWDRYSERIKDQPDRAKRQITWHGSYMDGVHPGRLGQFYQALVFARELCIAATAFNEKASALEVDAETSADLKAFVYGWREAPALTAPASANR